MTTATETTIEKLTAEQIEALEQLYEMDNNLSLEQAREGSDYLNGLYRWQFYEFEAQIADGRRCRACGKPADYCFGACEKHGMD